MVMIMYSNCEVNLSIQTAQEETAVTGYPYECSLVDEQYETLPYLN